MIIYDIEQQDFVSGNLYRVKDLYHLLMPSEAIALQVGQTPTISYSETKENIKRWAQKLKNNNISYIPPELIFMCLERKNDCCKIASLTGIPIGWINYPARWNERRYFDFPRFKPRVDKINQNSIM
jgi:hypothetical protein